jgi:hypothetical protein
MNNKRMATAALVNYLEGKYGESPFEIGDEFEIHVISTEHCSIYYSNEGYTLKLIVPKALVFA